MRNKILIFITLSIVALISIIIVGCKNDKGETDVESPVINIDDISDILTFAQSDVMTSNIEKVNSNYIVHLERGYKYKTGDGLYVLENKEDNNKFLGKYNFTNSDVHNLERDLLSIAVPVTEETVSMDNVYAVVIPKEFQGLFERNIEITDKFLDNEIEQVIHFNVDISSDLLYTKGESLYTVLLTWDQNLQNNFAYFEVEIAGHYKVYTTNNYYEFVVDKPEELYKIGVRAVSVNDLKSDFVIKEIMTPQDNGYSPVMLLPIPASSEVRFTGAAYNNVINNYDNHLDSFIEINLKPSLYYQKGSRITVIDNKSEVIGEYILDEAEVELLKTKSHNIKINITEYLRKYNNSDDLIKVFISLTNARGEVISDYAKNLILENHKEDIDNPVIQLVDPNEVLDDGIIDYDEIDSGGLYYNVIIKSSPYYQNGDIISINNISYQNSLYERMLSIEEIEHLKTKDLSIKIAFLDLYSDNNKPTSFINLNASIITSGREQAQSNDIPTFIINDQKIINEFIDFSPLGSIADKMFSLDDIPLDNEEVTITLPESDYYTDDMTIQIEIEELGVYKKYFIDEFMRTQLKDDEYTVIIDVADLFNEVDFTELSSKITMKAYISNDGTENTSRCVEKSTIEVIINNS